MTAKDLAKQWGYLYSEEVEALRETVLSLGDNIVVVNIGAGVGTSGMIFMECKNVGALYTVDITWEASPLGGLGNERITFGEAGYGNDPRHHQVCGDSTAIRLNWNSPIDYCFVDGCHTLEHCKSDILSWLPHIRPGGIISLHDYEANYWPGVTQAVNELLVPHYSSIKKARTFLAFRVT